MRVLLKLLVIALAVYVTAELLDGVTVRGGVVDLLVVAVVFGLVNLLVRPVVALLSFPFILLTLGLFLLVVNAAMFALTAALTSRLDVDGVVTALLAGVIVSVVSWLAETVLGLRRS